MIRLLRVLVLLAGTLATMLVPLAVSVPAEAAAGCGPRGCAAAKCGPRGCAAASTRHHPAYRPGYPGYRPGYPYRPPGVVVVNPRRYWVPGGAIAAGAAIGFVAGATAVAIAGQPPKPNYCWYYTSPAKTTGFWDVCPR